MRISMFARAGAIALALSSGIFEADAAIVGDYTNRKITVFFAYEDFGSGDVVFRVDIPVVGCEGGFWLRPSDPGFKSSQAAVMLAHAMRSTVWVWAQNDQLWTGSAAPTCRLHTLGTAQ